jgi:hypothetical protein
MIAYDLQCANGHTFEGWFEDDQTYRAQKEKGLLTCPVCNETSIARIPSTFAIKSSPAGKVAPAPQAELAKFGERMAEFVEKNFEDVGADFTKEALKIHYGVSEPRNIRGVSTPEEEKTLKEEGIEFLKIPVAKPSGEDA